MTTMRKTSPKSRAGAAQSASGAKASKPTKAARADTITRAAGNSADEAAVRVSVAALQAAEPQTASDGTDDRERLIRAAAYSLYERRGHVQGRELEDWLEAEREVDSQFAGLG